MKHKKNNTTKRTIKRDIDTLTKLVLANKSAIDVIGDFLYQYLEMKGETEGYKKFMEEKINGFMEENRKGDDEIPREPIQKEKKE
jgi:hypothetical protein